MKEYQVTLYIGGDKQWISVWADTPEKAKSTALSQISVLAVVEL